MKPTGIIKPLRTSAAALKKSIRSDLGGNHNIAVVLSFPKMLYLRPEAENSTQAAGKIGVKLVVRKYETIFRLAAYFGRFSSRSEKRGLKRFGFFTDSLFKSYAALSRLTQALWSIYRSNNLQLSQSLLALIRNINEKNGIELDAYFEEMPNIIHIRNRMISVLKGVDYSLLKRLSAIYGSLSVMNIKRREIYRQTEIIGRGSAANIGISRLTENVYTMTPLLTRIYEGIEAGMYLYSADSYHSVKTLWRLTNSLWKVYLGQNMELSRSFSRLITRVNLENKSVEQRNAENNMFSDNRSLKNLVNALRKAFSGSNLELRSSMISLFSDIHNAGRRRISSVNEYHSQSLNVGITLMHREIVPETEHIRLYHKSSVKPAVSGRAGDLGAIEREIKTRLDSLGAAPSPTLGINNAEDIVKEALRRVNKTQQLDWRLEKLQRGIF